MLIDPPLTLVDDFTADLQRWQMPVPGYSVSNILVFGELGAGKSTLINSLISLFSKSFQDPAISLRRETHVTTFLAPYQIHNSTFRLVDSVGLKFDENEPTDLTSILEGKYTFGKAPASEDTQNEQENRERSIHACILAVSRGFFSAFSEKSGSYEIVKSFIHELVTHNLHPILAVTQVDKSKEADPAQLSQRIERITGIPMERIFLIDNSRPRAKELSKEKALYSLLSVALDSCESHMQLEFDTNDSAGPGLVRRRSGPRLSFSSAEYLPPLPAKAHYLIVIDDKDGSKQDLYTEIIPESDRLTKLRQVIMEQYPKVGQFDFVNVFSGDLIPSSLERNVPVKYAARVNDDDNVVITIQRKPPPSY